MRWRFSAREQLPLTRGRGFSLRFGGEGAGFENNGCRVEEGAGLGNSGVGHRR